MSITTLKSLRERPIVWGIAIVLSVCIVTLALALWYDPAAASLREYAEDIVAECAGERHRPTCYDTTIPRLYGTLSLAPLFEVIRQVQAMDPAYGYCHLLGHSLGELEVAQDPSRWMDVMVECPQDGMCANGCMHGALIKRFAGAEAGMTEAQIEEAVPDLTDVCEPRPGWQPSGLDQGNCYHGLGHLAMYITLGDMPRSVELCNRFGKKADGRDVSELCYGGVFMQLFQPLEPEDEAMVAHIDVSKDNFVEFCNSFPKDGGRRSCFARGSMLFEDAMTDGAGMQAFCELSGDPQIESECYDMVFALVGSGSSYDLERIDSICRTVVGERAGDCYGSAAINMLDADPLLIPRAMQLCAMTPGESGEATCYGKVARYAPYRFNTGTDEFDELCTAFPDRWREQCYSGE